MLNSESFELEKIHINDNGAEMMTKSLPREKLEACYFILRWRGPPPNLEGGDLLGWFSLMCEAQTQYFGSVF